MHTLQTTILVDQSEGDLLRKVLISLQRYRRLRVIEREVVEKVGKM